MTGLAVNVFQGSVPRKADHLMSSGASIALDCKLEHGKLESWRKPKLVSALAPHVRSHYCLEGVTHLFDCVVSIARGAPTCKEFFATGIDDPVYGPGRLMRWVPEQGQQWELAGMPDPVAAAEAYCADAEDQEDSHMVTYSYQYFRSRDRAYGPISAASAPILTNPYAAVDLLMPAPPDPEWGVDQIIIFRSVFGMTGYDEMVNVSDHSWVEVGRIGVAEGFFEDEMDPVAPYAPATHDLVIPPPEGLRDVVNVSGTTIYAGFKGRSVFFSQNNEHYNWPHEFALEDNICALAESNGIVYVMTDSYSYSIQGVIDCDQAGVRPIVRHPTAYPIVVTGARNVCSIPEGVVYISPVGAVVLTNNAPPVVVTSPFYAEDDWQQLVPESLVPAYYRGRLYVFGYFSSFALTMSTSPEQGLGNDTHTELSMTDVLSVGYSRSGVMQLVVPGELLDWDRGEELLPHFWKSGEYVMGVPMTFGACKVVHNGGVEHITIEGDGRSIIAREVPFKKDFTLPLWGTSSRYYITLSGVGSVKLVSIATSMKELKA